MGPTQEERLLVGPQSPKRFVSPFWNGSIGGTLWAH